MIAPGPGVRVYLACGVTDMRKGIAGLSAVAQEVLRQRPASGAVFAFRGRRGDRIALVLGRARLLPLLQGSRAWPLSLAVAGRRDGAPDRGAACHVVGRDRLAASGMDLSAAACGVIILWSWASRSVRPSANHIDLRHGRCS